MHSMHLQVGNHLHNSQYLKGLLCGCSHLQICCQSLRRARSQLDGHCLTDHGIQLVEGLLHRYPFAFMMINLRLHTSFAAASAKAASNDHANTRLTLLAAYIYQ